jgi:hypothetical protein
MHSLHTSAFASLLPRRLRLAAHILLLVTPLAACGDDDSTTPDAGRRDGGRTDAGTFDSGNRDAGPGFDAGDVECSLDSTLGNACSIDAECTDGCFCNGAELCIAGACTGGVAPCADDIRCTALSCDEATNACEVTTDDALCDDGNPCNGAEVCDAVMGCLPGFGGADCNDGDSCTIDSCDAELGCEHRLRDLDGDGYPDNRCAGGDDCNDDPLSGFAINPGAAEVCDSGRDENCDGFVDIADPMCRATNDTCATPIAFAGSGTIESSTLGLADDYTLSCGSVGPEAVFSFTLLTARDVVIRASSSVSTAIELRPAASCATGDGLRCVSNTAGSPMISELGLPAGDYVVLVNTTSPAVFQLTFEVSGGTGGGPIGSDACNASATEIGGGGRFRGQLDTLADDYPTLSCNSVTTARNEAAYRLTLGSPRDVQLRVTGASSTGASRIMVVSLLGDCTDFTSERACHRGTTTVPAELSFRGLTAGTYWVLVETTSTLETIYDLDVQVTSPMAFPTGDVCLTAPDITDTSISIPIATLTNQGGLGCGGATAPWVDAFFTVDIPTTRNVTVTTTAGGVHLMSLGEECQDPAAEFLCRAGTPSISESVTLAAGTYTVGVAVPASMSGMLTVSAATSSVSP